MEELKDIGGVCELLERGDVRMAESAVGLLDERAKVRSWNLVFGDVEGEDFNGEIYKEEVLPCGLPVWRELWDMLWDIEATVWSESGENGLGMLRSETRMEVGERE